MADTEAEVAASSPSSRSPSSEEEEVLELAMLWSGFGYKWS